MSDGLTIYALGDTDFMIAVLNGVAAMTNDHDIYRLAMIGALCGVIAVVFRMITTGGREFPFWHLLLSIVLAVVLLKPTTTVWVQPLTPQPGSIQGMSAQKVDNVPYLVALPGFFITHIGIGITEAMDTAFQMPDGSGIASGGLLSELEVMAAPSRLFHTCTANGAAACSVTSEAVQTYLHDCVFPASAKGELPLSTNLNTMTGIAAVAVNDAWLTTTTKLPLSGDPTAPLSTPQSVSCPDLKTRMSNLFGSQALYSKLLDPTSSAAGLPVASNTGGATNAIAASFASYNFDIGKNLGNYYADMYLASNWRLAQAGGPMAFAQSSALDTAVEQASFQRAMQVMGEQSMFMKIMRPMIGFFESLIYAIAPFMAFLLMVGPTGLSMIMRYIMVTLWVEMWFPILAIVNLYIGVQLEHAANMLKGINGVAQPVSVTGMITMTDNIVNLMTTGSMLAASTPALALSLIYGGAVTATFLAGKLGGADHINEKIPAPDGMKEMPVTQYAAMFSGNQVTGAVATGQSNIDPVIATGSTVSRNVSSAQKELESASDNFSKQLGLAMQNGMTWAHGDSVNATDTLTSSRDTSLQEAEQLAHKYGVDYGTTQNLVTEAVNGNSMSYEGRVGGDAAAGFKVAGTGAGFTAGGSASTKENHGLSTKGTDGKAASTTLSQVASEHRDLSDSLKRLAAHSVLAVQNTNSSAARSFTQNTGLTKAAQDVVSKERSYSIAQSASDSVGISQSRHLSDLSQSVLGRLQATGSYAVNMANWQQLLGDGFEKNMQSDAVRGIADPAQREVAAAILGLAGQGSGYNFMPREMSQQRADAFDSLMAGHSDVARSFESARSTDANAYEGVGERAHGFGSVSAEVNKAPVGSTSSMDGVRNHLEETHTQAQLIGDKATDQQNNYHPAAVQSQYEADHQATEHAVHERGKVLVGVGGEIQEAGRQNSSEAVKEHIIPN